MIYDVVVIGASTAGLYAAEILALNDKKVALFDRNIQNNPDIRTYIITPGLERIVPNFDPILVRHETGVINIQVGEEERSIHLSAPDLIIERSQLIESFLSRAKKAGVEIYRESEFIGFGGGNKDGSIRIKIGEDEKTVQTRYLIGADGVNSRVRDLAGMKSVPQVPLLQADIELPEKWDPDVTKVWFDVNDSPYFYWLIPDKEKKAVVGLISERGVNIQMLLDNFLNENSFIPLSYQSGQAGMFSPRTRNEISLDGLHILLVGDAAGQVKVTTVGGSVTGFAGAQAAANAILENKAYRTTLRRTFREMSIHYFIRSLLDQMSNQDYLFLLRGLSPGVKSFLNRYDRDQMRRNFWKLIFIQPKYIFLGLKLFFRLLLPRR